MPNYTFELNGKKVTVDAPADLSVLWTLRDKLGVTGPKYGCGINVCQACTSHVDDAQPFNPCVTNVSEIAGRRITTIEGLAKDGKLTPVQQAWLEQDVAQCGYCQPGQIMAATSLLKTTLEPTDADIDALDNVCRCGSYFRIRQAIKRSVQIMQAQGVDATGAAVKGGSATRPSTAVPDAGTSTTGSTGATSTGAPTTGAAATGVSTSPAAATLPTTGVDPALAGGAAVLVAGAAVATKVAQSALQADPA